MAVKRKGGQSGLHILSTSTEDRLTARKLVVLGVLNLDARIGLGILSRLVLARRDVVNLAGSGDCERRAQDGGSGAARALAENRYKRHDEGLNMTICEEGRRREGKNRRDWIAFKEANNDSLAKLGAGDNLER
jgi:hypothetical protein